MKMTDLAPRMAEFSIRDAECWLYSSTYGTDWQCQIKLQKDGDKMEFTGQGDNPCEAFENAYNKYSSVIQRAPEYNPNRLLESSATETEEVSF